MNLDSNQIFYISFLATCLTVWVKMVGKLGKGYGLGVPITKLVEPSKSDSFKKIAFNVWFGMLTITIIILIKVIYQSVFLRLY